MNIPTLMAIKETQNRVLAIVAPEASHLIENFDSMDVEEFYTHLLGFAMEITSLTATLTTEVLVGAEAMGKVIEEMQEFDSLADDIINE